MQNLLRLGRPLLGIGVAGIGFLSLVFRDAVPGLEPIPATLPGHLVLTLLVSGVLIAAGASLALNWHAPLGAAAVTTVSVLWLLLLHLPVLAGDAANPLLLTAAAQTLMLAAASAFAWATLPRPHPAPPPLMREDRLATASRIAFALPLFAFGALHFRYHVAVSGMIPHQVPARAWWPYATGLAFLAAGAAIVTRTRARLAASLLGAMFAAWVFLVHWPRVVANPGSQLEWTGLALAVALTGASWIVASPVAADVARVGWPPAPLFPRRQLDAPLSES